MSSHVFVGMVVLFVYGALASPRREAPKVRADFWRQYQLAQELEEVRTSRPSAYRALPAAPGESDLVADLSATRDRRRPARLAQPGASTRPGPQR